MPEHFVIGMQKMECENNHTHFRLECYCGTELEWMETQLQAIDCYAEHRIESYKVGVGETS